MAVLSIGTKVSIPVAECLLGTFLVLFTVGGTVVDTASPSGDVIREDGVLQVVFLETHVLFPVTACAPIDKTIRPPLQVLPLP